MTVRYLFLTTFLLTSAAFAAPSSFTYQGRILKADGTPLEYNNVSFQFQVTNPTGSCILYQEEVDGYDMTNSGGVFDTAIGNGTRSYPISGSLLVSDAFNNGSTFACKNGGNYTPAVDDGRMLRVQFHDGVGWKTISPDNIIRSIPFASFADSANKIGTHGLNEMIFKPDVNSNVSCNAGSFLTWDATAQTFGCAAVSGATGGTVTSVTSANSYLSVASGTTTPVLTANVGTAANTLAAGNDTRIVNALQSGATAGGDLTGTYPDPTVSKIANVGLLMTSLTSGQFLKYNGTNWVNAAVAQGDVTGLSTTISGLMTNAAFNADVASAGCTTSQTMYWNSVTSAFACQAISVANFSGSLTGDVTGTQTTTSVVKIKGYGVDFSTAPASGDYLKYNGTNWISTTLSAGDLPTGTITGAGTAGYIPYYSTTTALANSPMFVSSTSVGVGTTSPISKLTVYNSYLTLDRPVGNYQGTQYTTAGSARWLTGVSNDAESGSNVGSNYFLNRYNDSGTLLGTSMLVNRSNGNVTFATSGGGNVAIGTTSPNGELDVHRNGTTPYSNNGTGSNTPFSLTVDPVLTVSNFNNTDASGAYLNFATTATDSTQNGAYIGGISKSSQYGADLIFGRRSVASGWAESMTILGANGFVGIGTSAPSVALEVNGTIKATSFSGPVTATTTSSGAGSNTNPSMTFSGDPDTGFYDAASDNTISIATGGTKIFDFTSAGLISPTTGGADITTAAGTETAPTYSFAGDTGTGWWRPAVSTMAASTGGHERMRIDASGDVGIGTTAPTTMLDINNTAGPGLTVRSGTATGNQAFALLGGFTVGDIGLQLGRTSQTSGVVTLQGIKNGTGANNLSLQPSGGNVGIGTNNPASTLSVYKMDSVTNGLSSLGVFTHMSSGTAAANLGGVVQFAIQNSSGLPVGSADIGSVLTNVTSGSETGDFFIRTLTGGTLNERLRVTAAGTVGIGTAVPSAMLDVNGAALIRGTETVGAGISTTGKVAIAGQGAYLQWNKSTGDGATWLINQKGIGGGGIRFGESDTSDVFTERMRIDYNGNVGFGTTAPNARIHNNGGIISGNVTAQTTTNSVSSNHVIGYTNTAPILSLVSWQGTGNYGNTLVMAQAGGSAEGSYTAVGSGAKLGAIEFHGSDGSSFNAAADITAVSAAAGSTGSVPAHLEFSTRNTSGVYAERMRITSSGNVGIGTTIPKSPIHAQGPNGSSAGLARFTTGDYVDASVGSGLLFRTGANTGDTYSSISALSSGFTANNNLILNPTGGNVGIGTTAPASQLGNSATNTLDVVSNGINTAFGMNWVVPSGAAIGYVASFTNQRTTSANGVLISSNDTSTASRLLEIEGSGATKFVVRADGSVGIGTATPGYTLDVNGSVRGTSAYVNSSDVRFKKNIEIIPDSLNKILQVRGVTFDWRTDEFPEKKFSKDHDMGVIAQEVEAVFPEAVRTDDQGYKSVAYSELVAPLINAVKELYAKWSNDSQGIHRDIASVNAKVDGQVSKLESENAALKAENAAMKTRLDKIEKMLNSK